LILTWLRLFGDLRDVVAAAFTKLLGLDMKVVADIWTEVSIP
jgi:hypothetical protein